MKPTILFVDGDTEALKEIKSKLENFDLDLDVVVCDDYKSAIKSIATTKYLLAAFIGFLEEKSRLEELLSYLERKQITTLVLSDEGSLEVSKDHYLDKISKKNPNYKDDIVGIAKRVAKNFTTTVLIVEDSASQLAMAVQMLQKMNLNVITACDGKEALEKLHNSKQKISLILTDYYMPNMDGMEFTIEVRKLYKKDELGIIVLSANNKPEIATLFVKNGANDYINKPYGFLEFNTRVNSNLDLLDLFAQIKDQANRDFLTKLHNRRFFFESGRAVYHKAARVQRSIALAMIDIDHFKKVNDQFGHDVGDAVICDLGNLLRENIRTSDLLARFGGEEFCVMLDNISFENVEFIFEKIRKKVQNHITTIDDAKIQFTVSIGVYYGLDNSLDLMIRKADEQLYISKNSGRNMTSIKVQKQ